MTKAQTHRAILAFKYPQKKILLSSSWLNAKQGLQMEQGCFRQSQTLKIINQLKRSRKKIDLRDKRDTNRVHTNWFPVNCNYLNYSSRSISLIQSIMKSKSIEYQKTIKEKQCALLCKFSVKWLMGIIWLIKKDSTHIQNVRSSQLQSIVNDQPRNQASTFSYQAKENDSLSIHRTSESSFLRPEPNLGNRIAICFQPNTNLLPLHIPIN